MKKENKYQSGLINRIHNKFPGSIVLKNDAGYISGIPDLLVLYEDHWAALECKRETKAHKQPLQDFYISKMNRMSFARFINPENEQEVLDEMEQTFAPKRSTLLSKRKPA